MNWKQLKRDPFAWALVAGIVLVTLSVPFFRHEPPAPAPIADMPAWTLTDASGAVATSAALAGRTYVLVLTDPRCTGTCARIAGDLATMHEMFLKLEADVAIVRIDVAAHPDATCAFVKATFARLRRIQVPCERLHDLADDPHALIVDGQGRIRSIIRLDRPGLDETFHRALAVEENRPFAK